MKMLCWALATGAVAALLSGCGGESGAETTSLPPLTPREIDITLDGYAGPETVGILMAYRRGYFEDLGLNVWVRTPASRLRPVPYVAHREVALSVSHLPQVALAREKDAPIVAFGSLISQPTAAVIWLEKSKIGGIADLKGKTIAITGLPFERDFLQSLLSRAGLTTADVKVKLADYELVHALVKGEVDAILGSWSLEGAALKARGLKPVITRVQSLGIPAYDEFVVIGRPDRLAGEPRAIRNFMTAVALGTEAAIEDPEAAVNAIRKSIGANPDLSRKTVEAEVKATLPLLSRSGYLDPDQAEGLTEWMREEGMTQGALPASELLTDRYLPRSERR